MKLIFLGAPGAGKGTQAEFVSEHLQIPTISTGNIIREALKSGTEMGLKAKAYIDAGEGCLSVDEEHPGHVIRHFKITVEAFDAKSHQNIVITARGYDAIVLQHEIDHLDGILFYDRIDKVHPDKTIPGAYVC